MMRRIALALVFLVLNTSNNIHSMDRIRSAFRQIDEMQLPTVSLEGIQMFITFSGAAEALIGTAGGNEGMVYGGTIMAAMGLSLYAFDKCIKRKSPSRWHFPEAEEGDDLV